MADNVRKFGEKDIDRLMADYPNGEGLSIYIEDTETTFVNSDGEIVATGNGVYDLVALWDKLLPEASVDFAVGSDDGGEDEADL